MRTASQGRKTSQVQSEMKAPTVAAAAAADVTSLDLLLRSRAAWAAGQHQQLEQLFWLWQQQQQVPDDDATDEIVDESDQVVDLRKAAINLRDRRLERLRGVRSNPMAFI